MNKHHFISNGKGTSCPPPSLHVSEVKLAINIDQSNSSFKHYISQANTFSCETTSFTDRRYSANSLRVIMQLVTMCRE